MQVSWPLRRVTSTAVLIPLATLLAACGNGSGAPARTTTTPAAVGTTEPPAVGTTEPPAVGTTEPAAVGTTEPAHPLVAGAFTGFGATLAKWATTHEKSKDPVIGDVGASYWGPKTTSATVFAHKFVVLQVASARVIALEINFPSGTSLGTAKEGVLSQLPTDAKVTFSEVIMNDTNNNSCLLINMKSPLLGTLLSGAPFNDPTGLVGVELATVNSAASLGYSASNINAAFLQLNSESSATTC